MRMINLLFYIVQMVKESNLRKFLAIVVLKSKYFGTNNMSLSFRKFLLKEPSDFSKKSDLLKNHFFYEIELTFSEQWIFKIVIFS